MERSNSTRIISVSSGKGGVGKTNISVNLALALAEEGAKTCLFDADLGLANINIILGIDPEYTIEDVISGEKALSDIIIRNFYGIDIISGSSGVEKIANLENDGIQRLRNSLQGLSEYDFLIFDTSAGITSPVTAFCMAATELLLIITSEPTSMTDAYALLKVLLLNGFKGQVKIVVNQCKNVSHAKKIYNSFNKVVSRFLNKEISLTGFVLKDLRLEESVKRQTPFILLYPDSNAARCVKHMAKMLLSKEPAAELNQEVGLFWQRCFDVIKSRLRMSIDDSDHEDKISLEAGVAKDTPVKENDKMISLMNKLVDSLTDISGELHDINAYLRNGNSLSISGKGTQEPRNFHSIGNEAVILDYEEFLRNRTE